MRYRTIDDIQDILDDIKFSLSEIEKSYEDEINDIEERRSTPCGTLERFSEGLLQSFGGIVNAGAVLSLRDDLKTLLTTKYNISIGNI